MKGQERSFQPCTMTTWSLGSAATASRRSATEPRRRSAVAVPEAADVVGEQVVAGVDLPADGDGVEVDHGRGDRGDDGLEDGVVGFLVGRVGEGIGVGDVGVVDGADLALFAMDFAEVGAGFEAAAGELDELRVEAGHVGDLGDHVVGGGGVLRAGMSAVA